MQDDIRSGRPVSARDDHKVDMVREKIRAHRRLSIRELSVKLDMGYRTVERILPNDLGMTRVCAKFLPRLLTEEQKQRRI